LVEKRVADGCSFFVGLRLKLNVTCNFFKEMLFLMVSTILEKEFKVNDK
jgi:hypothetical protein